MYTVNMNVSTSQQFNMIFFVEMFVRSCLMLFVYLRYVESMRPRTNMERIIVPYVISHFVLELRGINRWFARNGGYCDVTRSNTFKINVQK